MAISNIHDILEKEGIEIWGYTEEGTSRSFEHYQSWVHQKKHGKLKYLEDHRKGLRKDLRMYFPEFQSALVCLFPYRREKKWSSKKANKIAGYALAFSGKDYHLVIRDKLNRIGKEITKVDENICYKLSIDIQPVLERDLAFRAGLGWFGKNSMLISREEGSYFLIGSLLLSRKLNLEKNENLEVDHCGNCRRCIDACPTSAITNERTLIANQCISTFTIETFKDEDPPAGYDEVSDQIFGCDICQEVCPWNKKPLLKEAPFDSDELKGNPVYDLFLEKTNEEVIEILQGISNREYKRMFKGTALERPGRIGMIKNLKAIQNKRVSV